MACISSKQSTHASFILQGLVSASLTPLPPTARRFCFHEMSACFGGRQAEVSFPTSAPAVVPNKCLKPFPPLRCILQQLFHRMLMLAFRAMSQHVTTTHVPLRTIYHIQNMQKLLVPLAIATISRAACCLAYCTNLQKSQPKCLRTSRTPAAFKNGTRKDGRSQ